MSIRLHVTGAPVPQGSVRSIPHRTTGKPVTMADSANLSRYRGDLREAARRVDEHYTSDVAVSAHLVFIFRRPANHWLPINSRRPAPVLKPGAPTRMAQKPDIDKLIRAVLDALTGEAYADDQQVIYLTATKRWSDVFDTTGWTTVVIEPWTQ